MTTTEDRLADALAAAARAVPQETLRPLTAPDPRRHRPAWLVPVAAATAVALVVGLAVAVSSLLPGSGQGAGSSGLSGTGSTGAPPRYYVEADISSDKVVVRGTASGAVIATVPVPVAHDGGNPAITAASNGTFFVAAFARRTSDERIYRFRLTAAGQVTGFAPVPGSVLSAGQQADALAASPDGSQLALGISFFVPHPKPGKIYPPAPPDQIVAIDTATGMKTVWRGGTSTLGRGFSVASLSWTADGRELVFLGQWCGGFALSSEACGNGRRTAQVRTLDPASGGGPLDSGQLLLGQSARLPYIAQALISPDGSTITAIVLTGPVTGSDYVSGTVPSRVSVRRISVATGRPLSVLYRRDLGSTAMVNGVPDFLALHADGVGQHWMLVGGISAGPGYDRGFNGWIDDGRLAPLKPVNGRIAAEAW